MNIPPRASARTLVASLLIALGTDAATGQMPQTSRGDPALGEYLASECATCHQITGRASTGIPSILAWPDDQFVAVMQSYRSRERDSQIMQTIAGRLSDEELHALAAYFGGLAPQPAFK
jgi:cytochrome c553